VATSTQSIAPPPTQATSRRCDQMGKTTAVLRRRWWSFSEDDEGWRLF
ncbi:hypothetical protein A2U01_0052564, partial [Trifolium medium]|nr:hypothetical protein [Trifolium medium]